MSELPQLFSDLPPALRVNAGEDRFGEHRVLGISTIEVTKANAMPPQDPALWRAHGMELLGLPLAVE
jgi:hypothetical protein